MSAVWVALIAFLFGFIGSMPLAGPISVLVVSTAFKKEYANAVKLDLGASLAEGGYAFLAFWGFATFLARHKNFIPIAHAVTAVVLLAVGAHFLRWSASDPNEKNAKAEEKGASFFVGLSVSALNPTLFVTWSAAVAWLYAHQFIEMTGALAIPWGIAAAIGVGSWNLVIVFLIRRFHDRFPRNVLTWVVRAMGLLLIGLSAWSAVEFMEYLTHK